MGMINSGVRQWIFQRISNALIVTFGVALVCVLLSDNGLSYASLTGLLASQAWKIYFTVVLVMACVNSVLAAWQIDGDYAKKFGLPTNAMTILGLVGSAVFLYFGLCLLFS